MTPPLRHSRISTFALGLILLGVVIWLRWPGLGFNVWSLDEAIHATAARVILHGGILYLDVIDQRTPLSYYAIAGIFEIFGENNLWSVRLGIAVLIAATAFLLAIIATKWRGRSAGLWTAASYTILSCSLLFPGDANAAHTEWFLAFFTVAAAVVFLGGTQPPGILRVGIVGFFFGSAFLSKQPALLDLAAPVITLVHLSVRGKTSRQGLWFRLLALLGGWMAPVGLCAGYFAAHQAFAEGLFYTWTYNLEYYGAGISLADRINSLLRPFQHMASNQPILLIVWLGGSLTLLHRLLQRQPTEEETIAQPLWTYLCIWSLTSVAGAASGGRDFDHYYIQFLPALSLGCGLAMGRTTHLIFSNQWKPIARAFALILSVGILGQLGYAGWKARSRTLPLDSSIRVSAYIREHSSPEDRIFVWGFHPDIYFHTNRLPGSRYLYGSFQTGLIPWINVDPDQETSATIVPEAMEQLLTDLTASQPIYIVDCSAGPNRHWQKYPLEKFPRLDNYIKRHYEVVEGGQFVPQGFRLFARRQPGSVPTQEQAAPLPASVMAQLAISTLGAPLRPETGTAPNGASFSMQNGHAEYFAHAPSRLVYRVSPEISALRGGFGIRPAAYAESNTTPTDGAEFSILWRTSPDHEIILFRHLLQPGSNPADRGLQSFRVTLPSDAQTGELVLSITPGPTGNPACDWTFWTDLMFEKSY